LCLPPGFSCIFCDFHERAGVYKVMGMVQESRLLASATPEERNPGEFDR
jgi:hypothetical protein